MRLYMDLLAVVFHTVMQDIYNILCHIILMQSRSKADSGCAEAMTTLQLNGLSAKDYKDS